MSFRTESTFRSITTPSPVNLDLSEFSSISPSFANQHLSDLDKNKDLQQIQKKLSLIQDFYEPKLSIQIDSYHPTTWIELFKNPEHIDSRQRSHHMNVCFCFLFAVSIDVDLDNNTKIDMIAEALKDLSLDHSFDLCASFLKIPPIMAIFILPYSPAYLKDYVFKNASNPDLLLSWTSIIFEHRTIWPEPTQKYFLSLLSLAEFSSSRTFRTQTSSTFKGWFSLINGTVATDSNSTTLHHSGTIESLESFNYCTEPTDLSQKLLTLYAFIKERKAERIQEVLISLQNQNFRILLSSFLEISPDAAIHILTCTPPDILQEIFKEISDETLLLWVEGAFESQETIGEEILRLLTPDRIAPSFLPYFHRNAARELQVWAESINPAFFPPSALEASSCRCVIS